MNEYEWMFFKLYYCNADTLHNTFLTKLTTITNNIS